MFVLKETSRRILIVELVALLNHSGIQSRQTTTPYRSKRDYSQCCHSSETLQDCVFAGFRIILGLDKTFNGIFKVVIGEVLLEFRGKALPNLFG